MSLIEVRDLSKNYGGLRPFRLKAFAVEEGDAVVLEGPDHQAAAVLTDLLTGTTLPDTGSIVIAGRPTSDLSGQDDWLAFLDRFGIVNQRVVLLDGLTIAANLAVPLTLDLDPMPPGVRRAVEAHAAAVGLQPAALDARLDQASPLSRLFVRLGRAIALDPAILLVEHPTADLAGQREVAAAADVLRRVAGRPGLTTVIVTSDRRLPRHVAARHLTWQAATGEVGESRGWRRWLS
jgi:ABC-type transporter Mla maintaining outer membrane lipid asymmetry ATPase subunit MlaF